MTEQENYANLAIGLLNAARELIDVGTQHGTNTTIRLAMDEAGQDVARARRGLTQALSAELLRPREYKLPEPPRTLASDRAEDR